MERASSRAVVDSDLGLLPGVSSISIGLSSLIPLGGVAAILIGGSFGACTGTGSPPAGGGGSPAPGRLRWSLAR